MKQQTTKKWYGYNPGMKKVLAKAGSVKAFARMLGISSTAVSVWNEVPVNRLLQIEQLFGVSRAELRPELYEGWEPINKTNQNG